MALADAMSDDESNATGSGNVLKSYQEKNKVLMDILEQRSEEIRTLRLRISNLVKNDCNGEGKSQENGVKSSTKENDIKWSHIELCKAFSLHRMNIPLFNYLREKFSIPLPDESDVAKFVRDLQFVRGVQATMLHMLENSADAMKDHEKISVLQVSYISTVELFEYDDRQDCVWGPHKYICAVVARGLYSDWAQLVYLNFDVPVNKQNLNSVIESLHKIGFPVAACSSTFDGTNDLWEELGVSHAKNHFLHPITNEQIFAFYFVDDLLVAANKNFIEGRLQLENAPLNKSPVMIAIQKNYRKIAIEKGLLEWADADCTNVSAIRTFFSQYTVNLLRMSSSDDRAAKNTVEFINIVKSFADIMSRRQLVDTDFDSINFDTFLEFQNKKLDRVYARLCKLQCSAQAEGNKRKFRDAMMMSMISLKMLRKSVLTKFKYSSFSIAAVSNEFLAQKSSEIIAKNNFERKLPPMQVFRILKEIFLGENSAIKLEPREKFFYSGAVTAAEVNGRNETFYAMQLIQWLCDNCVSKNAQQHDPKDLKRKLKKVEEAFCAAQNPNFRIRTGAVAKMTRQLVANAFGNSMQEIIQTFVLQRHLLRIKYLNENGLAKITSLAHSAATGQVQTITLEE